MWRRVVLLVLWLALLLAVIGVMALRRFSAEGPVVPVSHLQAELARDSTVWVGRIVRVRAMILSGESLDACMVDDAADCLTDRAYLMSPAPEAAPASAAAMPAPGALPLVVRVGQDSLDAGLRRLPLLDSILPQGQQPRIGMSAIYEVRIERAPASFPLCVTPPCYRAVLLNPVPTPTPSSFTLLPAPGSTRVGRRR